MDSNKKSLAALCLLAAAVSGFFVGRLSSSGEADRAGRTTRVPTILDESSDHAPDPARATGLEEGGTGVRGTIAVDVEPLGSAPAEQTVESGYVELRAQDTQDEWEARLLTRDIQGLEIVLSARLVSGQSKMWQLSAGAYPVWWWGSDGIRYSTVAEVEPGRKTVICITAPQWRPAEAKDVADLGTIDVSVAAPPKTPVSGIRVEVEAPTDSVSRYTNSDGRCRFHLMPGVYTVRVGAHRQRVALREKESTAVTFRHGTEGAVVFDHGQAHMYRLIPVARPNEALDVAVAKDAERSALLFIKPGVYDVRQASGKRGVVVGRVTVRSGAATRFGHVPPNGGIRIHVARKNDTLPVLSRGSERLWKYPRIVVGVVRQGDGAALKATVQRTRPVGEFSDKTDMWTCEAMNLPAGSYDIQVSAPGFTADARRVTVRSDVVVLWTELEWLGPP